MEMPYGFQATLSGLAWQGHWAFPSRDIAQCREEVTEA